MQCVALLGIMGSGMAVTWLSKGFSLNVYNRQGVICRWRALVGYALPALENIHN